MKRFKSMFCSGYLMLLLGSLLLSACSSSSATTPLGKAAANFDKQNYSAAFADLLPEANKGNSDAQYAIGYFYYNGLGVARNFQKAELWLHKAADQGNPKAVKALAMIEQAKASESFSAPPSLEALSDQ